MFLVLGHILSFIIVPIILFWGARVIHRYSKQYWLPASLKPYHSVLLSTPPDDTVPAIVHALLKADSGKTGWDQAFATLLNLAHKGVLKIVQRNMAVPSYHPVIILAFDLELQPSLARLEPHEQVLLNMLFPKQATGRTTSMNLWKVAEIYRRNAALFVQAVQKEVEAQGMIDRTRARGHKVFGYLTWIFVAAMVDTILLAILFYALLPLSMTILLSIALFCFTIYILSIYSVISPLSDRWWQEAAAWRTFYQALSQHTGGFRMLKPESIFIEYLSHAANQGILLEWLHHAPGQYAQPSWFEGQQERFAPLLGALYTRHFSSTGTQASYLSLPYIAPGGQSGYASGSAMKPVYGMRPPVQTQRRTTP